MYTLCYVRETASDSVVETETEPCVTSEGNLLQKKNLITSVQNRFGSSPSNDESLDELKLYFIIRIWNALSTAM